MSYPIIWFAIPKRLTSRARDPPINPIPTIAILPKRVILGGFIKGTKDGLTKKLVWDFIFKLTLGGIFYNGIYKGLLANPITLKNYFENEKDEINIPEYLVKITKFSTSASQAIEYSKIIYDMFVRRELIKISDQIIDEAKENDLNITGQNIIENSEKLLYDLAEKGTFNSSLIKFDDAMKQTIEMASAAYKNEGGIVGVPTGLRDLDDKLGGLHQSDLIIIAGRPSMGKTSLATNIAFNAAQ